MIIPYFVFNMIIFIWIFLLYMVGSLVFVIISTIFLGWLIIKNTVYKIFE